MPLPCTSIRNAFCLFIPSFWDTHPSLTILGTKEAQTPAIDLNHKSQTAPVPYPTMLHSEQKCAHFCSEWSIVGYGTGAVWDLWNWSIHFISQHNKARIGTRSMDKINQCQKCSPMQQSLNSRPISDSREVLYDLSKWSWRMYYASAMILLDASPVYVARVQIT